MARKFGGVCTQYYAYAAASGLVAELSLNVAGVDAAVAATDETRERAYRDELPALSRYLAALRVGVAREEYEEGRRFAKDIAAVATRHGLGRTWRRVVAQWMSLEQRAGEVQGALARLEEFLGAFTETDYLRPLVREGLVSVTLLSSYVDRERNAEARASAASLLEVLQRVGGRWAAGRS